MNQSPALTFMEQLLALFRPIGGRKAIMDEDLAPLLGVDVPRLRSAITRSLQRIPEGEVFRPSPEDQHRWALTEMGALMVTSRIHTSEAAAISVGIVREVFKARRQTGFSMSCSPFIGAAL
jgi:hypothetical protein